MHYDYVIQGLPQFVRANFNYIIAQGGDPFIAAKQLAEHVFDTKLPTIPSNKAIQLGLILILRDPYLKPLHETAVNLMIRSAT